MIVSLAPTADADSQALEAQMAASNSVLAKISVGLDLLKKAQINNLLLREGHPVEGETLKNGEVAIVPWHFDAKHDGDNALSRDELKALSFLISSKWETEILAGGIDGMIISEAGVRYRLHAFLWGGKPTDINDSITGRFACTIRVIPNDPPALEQLGLPAFMRTLADANYGLLLAVGPTGSGKTSTMASVLEHINRTKVGHIIKIEDPIEYMHTEDKCRITAREVGSNVPSFESGVQDALRELPLAISVGEIRNAETLKQTMHAARSGHYVTATRHAPDLVSAIRALVDDMPGEAKSNAMMVSKSLLGVIFQVCVPGLDDKWHYVHEVMNITNNEQAKTLIAEQKWDELSNLLNASDSRGTTDAKAVSLNHNLAKLVVSGKISALAADRRAYDRAGLHSAISTLKDNKDRK